MSAIPPVTGPSFSPLSEEGDAAKIIQTIQDYKQQIQQAIGDYPHIDFQNLDRLVLSMHDYLESKKTQMDAICQSQGWTTKIPGDYKTMIRDSIRTLHNIHMGIYDDPNNPDVKPSLILANENLTELHYYMTTPAPPR